MFTSTECAELTLTPSLQPAKSSSLRGLLALAGLAIAAVLAGCGAPLEQFPAMDTGSIANHREAATPMWVGAHVGVPNNLEYAVLSDASK